eukprot:1384983-Amphidinium_carterae.1
MRSDSLGARYAVQKSSSRSWTLNALVAELALRLERWGLQPMLGHFGAELNTAADALSRRVLGAAEPPFLQDVPWAKPPLCAVCGPRACCMMVGGVGPGSPVEVEVGEKGPSALGIAMVVQVLRRLPRIANTPSGSRGSKRRAIEIAGEEELVAAAIENLDDDVYAAKSRSALRSRVKVWGEVHRAAFKELPVYPLSLAKVRAIMAILKASGYRSALGYLSAAREDAR